MAEQTTAFFAEEAAKQQARIVEKDKELALTSRNIKIVSRSNRN